MRSFAIPAASLSLTLTTACGPGLMPLGDGDGEDTGSDWPPDNGDTNVPTDTDTDPPDTDPPDTDPPDTDPPDTDPGTAISGNWQGTLMETSQGSTALPYSYNSYFYSVYVGTSLSLSAQITGTMHYRYEVLYFGIPYADYSNTFSCTGSALGNNSYSITMQSTTATLQMQCAHQGAILDCMSTGADPLRLVFSR